MKQEKYDIIKCTNCGNDIRVRQGTVAVFCVKCQNWIKIKNDRSNKQEKP